jgi:hypothetical protein
MEPAARARGQEAPMMTTKTLILAFGFILLCWSNETGAFECPRPETSSPGVLQESKKDEQQLSQMFTGGDIESKIGVAVASLQKKYPKATDTEIINYLVGAYCTAVSDMPGLTDANKTARIEHFSATLFEMLSQQKL